MNAVILAAGLGSRLAELTIETPKPLIVIGRKPIIEIQIEYLKEIGVDDIYIVVGYKANLFQYLVNKYNVNIIYNPYYSVYNNLYSLYLVRNILGNTYILDGDILITKNFLLSDLKQSTYFSIKKEPSIGEWMLLFSSNTLQDIIIIDEHNIENLLLQKDIYIISGVSYWAKEEIMIFHSFFNMMIHNNEFVELKFVNLFWDHIIYENRTSLPIKIVTLDENDLFEIDNIIDLKKATRHIIKKKDSRLL